MMTKRLIDGDRIHGIVTVQSEIILYTRQFVINCRAAVAIV